MNRRILIAECQDAVATATGVTVADLRGRRGDRRVISARFAAVWLAVRLTDHSLGRIGRHFGGRDHSTISAARDRAEALRGRDRDYDALLRRLERQLRAEPEPPAGAGAQLGFFHGPLFDLAGGAAHA